MRLWLRRTMRRLPKSEVRIRSLTPDGRPHTPALLVYRAKGVPPLDITAVGFPRTRRDPNYRCKVKHDVTRVNSFLDKWLLVTSTLPCLKEYPGRSRKCAMFTSQPVERSSRIRTSQTTHLDSVRLDETR